MVLSMNVLFLTISRITDIATPGIYTDLMRKFRDEGHDVYIASPRERRFAMDSGVSDVDGVKILGVKTLNLQKTNVVEKGIGTILLEGAFKRAIKRYWGDVKFDLVLYSTPPITFTRVVSFIKRRNPGVVSYLLLKDIFPQNAVDLGMFSARSLFYAYFRRKERKMYGVSDYIGCMSPANVRYVVEHNPEIDPRIVEIAPNSYDIPMRNISSAERDSIRERFGLPLDKPIFIYGGNMGKPQGIPFLIECLKAVAERDDCHFVVVGDGTEYPKLRAWVDKAQPKAVSLHKTLPKQEYDALTASCDVGLIFLDYRFTIPNYPSRLLPYLMERKPIIAATDLSCDTGTLAEEHGYGYWCPSNSVVHFVESVEKMLNSDLTAMGECGYRFYLDNYTTNHTYNAIVKHCNH